jgi:DNA-binding Lrp family transcriptional regulator
MRDLDRIDYEILTELQKNARLSNKELAVRVGLAPSSCLERVRKLTAAGVLRGAHADVNPASLGIEIEAMVAVRLARHTRDRVDAFQRYVMGLAEVVAIYHVAGENDFLIHVAVTNPQHLRAVVLVGLTTRAEVAHVETALVFGHERSPVLPNYLGSTGSPAATASPTDAEPSR